MICRYYASTRSGGYYDVFMKTLQSDLDDLAEEYEN